MEQTHFPISAPFQVPIPDIFGEPLIPKYTTLESVTAILEETDSVVFAEDQGMDQEFIWSLGDHWYGFLIVNKHNWDTFKGSEEKFENGKAYVMRAAKVSGKRRDMPPWEEIYALSTEELEVIVSIFREELVHRASFGIDWVEENDIMDQDVYLALTCREHFDMIMETL